MPMSATGRWGRKIPADRRAEVEKEIVRQKARIAILEIHGMPQGAVVRVDGNEIGRAPISAPVRVGVGKHTIAASAEGYDSAEKEVVVAGEDHKAVELLLAKRVVESPAPPSVTYVVSAPPTASPAVVPAPRAPLASAAVEPSTKPMSNVRLVGILVGVAGVAGMAAGGCAGGSPRVATTNPRPTGARTPIGRPPYAGRRRTTRPPATAFSRSAAP